MRLLSHPHCVTKKTPMCWRLRQTSIPSSVRSAHWQSDWPSLLPPGMTNSPALHAAVASLIGTQAGEHILETWADVAPADWGVSHTTTLINAVHAERCSRWTAAALIGPCDASAALLWSTSHIERTIQCWGSATPNVPTAWMDGLSSTERERLLDALDAEPFFAASCLPWLPTERSQRAIRKPDVWYHDGDHAVLMRSNRVCHDVHVDPIQPGMRPIGPMRTGTPSRRSSSPRRPTAGVRPTAIAARSSMPCGTSIARAVNGACVRKMFRQ